MKTLCRLLALVMMLTLGASAQAEQAAPETPAATKTAIFAGGCFWCMESDFEDTKGVVKVVSGYTGGTVPNPTYEQVSTGTTGHLESVQVTYDPAVVSYPQLLTVYWQNIDPFDEEGQFCDKGSQYHAAIFYGSVEEKQLAEESLKKVETKFGKPVATIIKPASAFYPAEEYHQDYHDKNKLHYQMYRQGCGRDARTAEIWGADKK